MRIAVAAVLLTGCIIEPPDSGPDYPPPGSGDGGWGSGWGGGGGSSGFGCHADSECPSTSVCARNGECLAASAVRTVRTTWTLRDQAASDTTCTSSSKLSITFSASSDGVFGFAPVPCDAGKFTVDKLPTRYGLVTLRRVNEDYGGVSASFDSDGNALVDLPY
jgi:hypothetical protein